MTAIGSSGSGSSGASMACRFYGSVALAFEPSLIHDDVTQ
jgi:hypothetical protein